MKQLKILGLISKLLCVGLVAALFATVMTQATSLPVSTHYQRVSDRLDVLKNKLAITQDEETYWQGYRQSILDNVKSNEILLKQENQQDIYTAPQYFAARLQRINNLSHHLNLITERFNELYSHLTSEQKAVADQYFETRRRSFQNNHQ
ncbi:MAG: hypothetical protein B7Z60_03750 [Ferrovum sp. 37-45-19]|uniref:Spy/CpxP family protein refolding chaperone n=1 Tax=Ferrovum sp. JA12 TaxID=1356299 RepID=UPI00070351BD|nr:Spy/CpxP family protein refolding chaperone [Ferrovum sp. JA12]OYV78920.1 MAG: hypothetical protein B7Z65_08365 [Ferrovum sp. 21-44-67]OYV94915.1 MAG: hypothetical protein B7Z60_03750 [Ferrovum sp. 37-45-19]HQT82258.1 Spy/CpxP family protein refolding chaperone [Ferrovaceae bacterium]KRH79330.1 hypothetical protein FERRO_03950 [Ferrovum sp. JA12]HQU06822.1 Spy/CpxP family protein refolding chaperone [Ferrovaceae bacterium]